VAPEHFESARTIGGARIRYLSPEPPPPAEDASRVLLAYTLEDYGRYALDTAESALAVLREVDPALRPTALTMVVAPLRLELASAHERAVLVSDRFYRIWPAERFRKFHRRQLARAVYAAWLLRRRLTPGPLDRDEAADLAAAWLADLFVLRRYERREFIQNILRPVSFVPAIDELLYAPQTMFADAYFGDGAADSAGNAPRDDPRLFMHARPRGRLYYARLRDLIGDRRLAGALSKTIARGVDLAAALAAAHGSPLGWFFRQWNLPAARVNYRLVGHSARRDGSGFVNRVEVARETAPGDRPPVEPVEIRATDRDGQSHRLRWSGRTQRAIVSYRSASPIDWAWVDPDARLQQTSVSHESQHARFDDRDRHRLRFVYNSFGVLLNVSDLSALLAADFSLSRVHDLENQLRFIAYASAAVRAGALISYRRGFGPEVTADRLLGRAALTLGVARLDGDFFAGADAMPRDATQATLTASLGGDTEVFRFEPLAKRDVRVAAAVSLTRRDEVTGAAADVLPSGELTASTSRTVTPRLGHTLAGELALAAAFGDIQSRAQLLTPGGADGVRGLAGARRVPARLRPRSRLELRPLHVRPRHRRGRLRRRRPGLALQRLPARGRARPLQRGRIWAATHVRQLRHFAVADADRRRGQPVRPGPPVPRRGDDRWDGGAAVRHLPTALLIFAIARFPSRLVVFLTELSPMRAYGDVVAGREDGAPAPLFGSETTSGVSRRSAQLPTSFEVAPVVVAYLREVGGESFVPRELEALLPAPTAVAEPPRARETVMLVAAVVLLFVAALAVALALLPRALS
jgi:hypothetical protein